MLMTESLDRRRDLPIRVSLENGEHIFRGPSLLLTVCYSDPGFRAYSKVMLKRQHVLSEQDCSSLP